MFEFICKFPLSGINWKELWNAYRTFLSNSETGIVHILAAQRYSNWEAWSRARLLEQAKHLQGQLIHVNLSELSTLPSDTLGGRFAQHLLAAGLDPNAFVDRFDDEDWFDQRTAVGHDLYHVVTGFDVSGAGEMGVAAFSLLQHWDLLNVFVLSFAPITVIRPGWTLSTLRNLWRGFRMGQRCQPIVGYAFEKNWETPINQVRKELGIFALIPQSS